MVVQGAGRLKVEEVQFRAVDGKSVNCPISATAFGRKNKCNDAASFVIQGKLVVGSLFLLLCLREVHASASSLWASFFMFSCFRANTPCPG
ncbi:hypothetical protein V6N13_000499 [Hibiscus sabdariffa]|uniref:Uncharacterized protein n=1 Tax=Hibiscus sabdariffa TaxID=183260 RepID=A0ABR2G5F9_9ROSI